MMKKLNTTILIAEEKNELYKEGYRFYTEGDYATTDTIDPWSGMPNTTHNIYVFDNEEEAEDFAKKQIWVFNENIHAVAKRIPEHTETRTEKEERQAKEKAERKAKRERKELEKAESMGLTLAEYKEAKAKERTIKNIEKEIEELEKELNEKRKKLEKIKNRG